MKNVITFIFFIAAIAGNAAVQAVNLETAADAVSGNASSMSPASSKGVGISVGGNSVSVSGSSVTTSRGMQAGTSVGGSSVSVSGSSVSTSRGTQDNRAETTHASGTKSSEHSGASMSISRGTQVSYTESRNSQPRAEVVQQGATKTRCIIKKSGDVEEKVCQYSTISMAEADSYFAAENRGSKSTVR